MNSAGAMEPQSVRARGPLQAQVGLRLLLVSPDAPAPLDQGFRVRVHHLAAALASRGHQLTMLAPAVSEPLSFTPPDGVELIAAGMPADRPSRARRALEVLRGGSAGWLDRRQPALLDAARELLARRSFDAVQVEVPELTDLALPVGVPLVLDAHNIWAELIARRAAYDRCVIRRVYRRLEHRSYARAETAAWRRCARVLATSDREAGIIAARGGDAVVIPNGVDVAQFRPSDAAAVPPEGARLVFTGLLSYRPNADGVRHLVRDIMPLVWSERPDASVQIVGGGATPDLVALANDPRVTFTGRVADVRPFVAAADIVVVALRMGSGTRLKILEAMALGRAIVTTSMGVEGIDARDGDHLVIADGAYAFSAAVLRVLRDVSLRRALGRSGRTLAVERYSWSIVGDRLDAMYRALVAEPQR